MPPQFPPIKFTHVCLFSCSHTSDSRRCLRLVHFLSFFLYVKFTFTGRQPVDPLFTGRFPSFSSLPLPLISGIPGLHQSCLILGLYRGSLIDTYLLYVSISPLHHFFCTALTASRKLPVSSLFPHVLHLHITTPPCTYRRRLPHGQLRKLSCPNQVAPCPTAAGGSQGD